MAKASSESGEGRVPCSVYVIGSRPDVLEKKAWRLAGIRPGRIVREHGLRLRRGFAVWSN